VSHEMAFKVIVAGGRDFDDYTSMCMWLDHLLVNKHDIEIVSGTARGADKLGERYALSRGYPVKKFPARWETFGKRAGMIRNRRMAEYADALVVFWDGRSRGTANMIATAHDLGLPTRTIHYAPRSDY